MFAFNQPIGWAIRQPLRLVPKNAVVPILSGPNRGMRWVAGSSAHGCWLGTYEKRNALFAASRCRPGIIAFDVGANAGYFTLLLSRAVGATGSVIALEPSHEMLPVLQRHLAINQVSNVLITQAAATQERGTAFFAPKSKSLVGHGTETVMTCRLDEFPTPAFIKMDVEGAELPALLGAQRIVSEASTTWLIELHGINDTEVLKLLGRDHRIEWLNHRNIVAVPTNSRSA